MESPVKSQSTEQPRIVITFGTFDLLHVGHVRILERAAKLGTKLIVGVSSDALNVSKKGKLPEFCETDRMRIVGALRCVDHVFLEESLELKRKYVEQYQASILVMGDDWLGRFDDEIAGLPCRAIYLPRTAHISTTQIKEKIQSCSCSSEEKIHVDAARSSV